ncbi:MAG: hypothetical protein CSA65_01415 [Proteobacteria bacterium]|nr:MAG: hypothetical protein CSA65_01415 [Pseudomonadota bacterium]
MAPVIDNQPLVTTQLRQPLRGHAPGAHMLVAKGAMGLSSPVDVGDDGSFCIEVDLMPDAPNQITLTPLRYQRLRWHPGQDQPQA